jgi:hypothetical protein
MTGHYRKRKRPDTSDGNLMPYSFPAAAMLTLTLSNAIVTLSDYKGKRPSG